MKSDGPIRIPGALRQPPTVTEHPGSDDQKNAKDRATEASTDTAGTIDPRPRIELPGEGQLVSDVASKYGNVLAAYDIYDFAGGAALYEPKRKTLEPISPAWFRTLSENYIRPFKVKATGKVDQSMSGSDARAILLSGQFRGQLREVERTNGVRLPVVRGNGEVELLPEGYDRESKILTVYDSPQYSTEMPVTEARAFMDGLFKDFPFADTKKSKAVALAAMLTLFGLDLMPRRTLAPVFLYLANLPGLGKGLLAQVAMISVLGYAPTGVLPKDEAEMRKLLFATAKEGRAAVFLDNVTGRLGSPALESFVTTSLVSGRILGTSVTLTCPKNSVVFVTGNTLTLNGDMSRRTLIVELFLDGDPAERLIENHLDENRFLELRLTILAALYALVREWAQAGKPMASKLNSNFDSVHR